MVYRFLMLSDENDFFRREFRINSDETFKGFNDLIIEDVGYDRALLTSFYTCDEDWNKKEEISLMDMGVTFGVDSYLMDETKLEDLIREVGDRLVFVYDLLNERVFFLELAGIEPTITLERPIVSIREGKAPPQELDIDISTSTRAGSDSALELDEDFYGEDEFDMDELDADGFGSLDDLSEDFY